MPQNVKQERRKAWITIAVFCAMLIGGTLWAAVLLPPENASSLSVREGAPPTVTTTAYQKMLKTWQGAVALFDVGVANPSIVYEINVLSLPEEERQRLAQGIVVKSEEELVSILENYSS